MCSNRKKIYRYISEQEVNDVGIGERQKERGGGTLKTVMTSDFHFLFERKFYLQLTMRFLASEKSF